MSMTNFTEADMPGIKPAAAPAKKAAPKKAAKKTEAPKAKKVEEASVEADAPEQTDSAELPGVPEQTDTETHGVGPSTVEGSTKE